MVIVLFMILSIKRRHIPIRNRLFISWFCLTLMSGSNLKE